MNEELRREFNKRLDDLIVNHKNRYLLEGIKLYSLNDIYFYLERTGFKLIDRIRTDAMFEEFLTVIGIDNIDRNFKDEAFMDIKVNDFSPVSGIKNITIRLIAQASLTEVMQKDYSIEFTDDFTDEKSYLYSNQLVSVIKEIEEESGIKYVPEIN